jgi:hypothetical protein
MVALTTRRTMRRKAQALLDEELLVDKERPVKKLDPM